MSASYVWVDMNLRTTSTVFRIEKNISPQRGNHTYTLFLDTVCVDVWTLDYFRRRFSEFDAVSRPRIGGT